MFSTLGHAFYLSTQPSKLNNDAPIYVLTSFLMDYGLFIRWRMHIGKLPYGARIYSLRVGKESRFEFILSQTF